MWLKTKLKNSKSSNQLENYVIDYILNSKNTKTSKAIKYFFKDLLNCGLQPGLISTLVDYNDMKQFYIKHLKEIHELQKSKESIKVNGNKIIFYSCLAIEETAKNIADNLKINYKIKKSFHWQTKKFNFGILI